MERNHLFTMDVFDSDIKMFIYWKNMTFKETSNQNEVHHGKIGLRFLLQ